MTWKWPKHDPLPSVRTFSSHLPQKYPTRSTWRLFPLFPPLCMYTYHQSLCCVCCVCCVCESENDSRKLTIRKPACCVHIYHMVIVLHLCLVLFNPNLVSHFVVLSLFYCTLNVSQGLLYLVIYHLSFYLLSLSLLIIIPVFMEGVGTV